MQRVLTNLGFSVALAILMTAGLLHISARQAFSRPLLVRLSSIEAAGRTTNLAQPVDSEAPTTPTELRTLSITQTAVVLTWDAATDDVAVTGYRLYERVRLNPYHWLWLLRINLVPTTSVTVTDLIPGSLHRYAVTAVDAAANESAKSTILELHTYQAPQAYHPLSEGEPIYAIVGEPFAYAVAALGVPPPTFTLAAGPPGMTVNPFSGLVTWAPQAGNEGIITITVRASNIVGSDDHTVAFPVHPAGTDLKSPGPVTDVTVDNINQQGATLSWTAAIDNVGVAGYQIVAQVAGHGQGLFLAGDTGAPVTTFVITSLQPGTSYRLWVAAYDAAGNVASISGTTPVQIMTLGAPPPATPTLTPTPTLIPTGVPTATPTATPTPTSPPTATGSVQIRIAPPAPSTRDPISISVAGVHPNSCTPSYETHTLAGQQIDIYSKPSDSTFCLPTELPWGYTLTVGTLAAGAYTVTHTLNEVVDRAFFTVTMAPTSTDETVPPYIYVGDDNQPAELAAGEPFTYTIEADGAPQPTYQLLAAPTGMTIDPRSGELSWTPPLDAPTVVTVTIRAVNSAGSDEQSLVLHVRQPQLDPDAPDQSFYLPLVRR